MKCRTCGSPNHDTSSICEYCGSSLSVLTAQLEAAGAEPVRDTLAATAAALTGIDEAPRLRSQISFRQIATLPLQIVPRNPLRWWAFFFPVGYLAGWGMTRAARLLLGYFAAAWLVIAMAAAINLRVGQLLFTAWLLAALYYCWFLATHVDALVDPKPAQFNVAVAVAFVVVQVIAYSILTKGI